MCPLPTKTCNKLIIPTRMVIPYPGRQVIISKRTCGRATAGTFTCDSAIFPVSGVPYTRVCGRIKAYQHIWTFAAGVGEACSRSEDACPCDASISISIPGFVGTDYFCESGVNSGSPSETSFYTDDPLWDGQGCGPSSTCCSFNTPPYFTKQLPTPTTDDIEARICQLDTGSSPVELIELYVQ